MAKFAPFKWDDPFHLDAQLTEDERMIRDAAEGYAQDKLLPRVVSATLSERFDREIMNELGALGLLGSTIEGYGCAGVSNVAYGLIARAVERVDSGYRSAMSVQSSLVMHPIHAYGSEEQKKMCADMVLAGDKPAICITEPDAGSDANGMTTRADKKGNRYVLNGRKHWITGGGVSRLHLIFAKVYDEKGTFEGIGGFLAIRDETKGLKITKREPTMGLRGIPEAVTTLREAIRAADGLPAISGLLENQVCVGDVLRFANCELAVSEPRFPCFKFNATMGFNQAAKLMVANAWCGYYLAVDEPGSIATGLGAGSAAIGVGLIGSKAVEAVGRNPGAFGNILTLGIIAMALAEGLGILAFFVSK